MRGTLRGTPLRGTPLGGVPPTSTTMITSRAPHARSPTPRNTSEGGPNGDCKTCQRCRDMKRRSRLNPKNKGPSPQRKSLGYHPTEEAAWAAVAQYKAEHPEEFGMIVLGK